MYSRIRNVLTSHPDNIVSKGHLRFTLEVIVWANINEAISQTLMNTTMNHLEMNKEKASSIVAKKFHWIFYNYNYALSQLRIFQSFSFPTDTAEVTSVFTGLGNSECTEVYEIQIKPVKCVIHLI